jgi:hypothetical protein
MEMDKEKENPILQHAPSEFYSEEALKAAEAIRRREYPALAAILKRTPEIAVDRGTRQMPLVAWAMAHDDPKSVELLLDAGALADDDVFDKDDKMSLLSLATGSQIPEFFDLLLSHGANPNGLSEAQPPLFVAVILSGYTYSDRFERLLRAGADPNQRNEVGVPIIHVCANLNDYEKALELVKRGADPNAKDNKGITVRWNIERYPLDPGTPGARAQAELARILK